MPRKYPKPLTGQEQANVRIAMRYLRVRFGTWVAVSRAVRVKRRTVRRIREGQRVRVYVAQRVATLAAVSLNDLRAGRFPATWRCPVCDHGMGGRD